MGILRGMVVRAGCSLVLAAAIAFGFLYRQQIWDAWRQWRGNGVRFVDPAPGGAASARDKLRRLTQSGGPAYVDLSAGEVAAVVEAALSGTGQRRVLDSVQVVLEENALRVRGSLDLSGVPRNLMGPLADAVGEREPVAIGGSLSVDSTGQLYLTVTYLQLRDFPFPRATIPRILAATRIPGARDGSVPLPGLPRAGDVRVSPRAVRFYRSSPQ